MTKSCKLYLKTLFWISERQFWILCLYGHFMIMDSASFFLLGFVLSAGLSSSFPVLFWNFSPCVSFTVFPAFFLFPDRRHLFLMWFTCVHLPLPPPLCINSLCFPLSQSVLPVLHHLKPVVPRVSVFISLKIYLFVSMLKFATIDYERLFYLVSKKLSFPNQSCSSCSCIWLHMLTTPWFFTC